MNDTPMFSICIPCYNHEEFIEKTIRSVLDQDFDDFEIIVSDNASTDRSRDVVRAINDPRVILRENTYNIGFAPNLQHATRDARGKFVNLLSSDDVMNPGALRMYAELAGRYSDERRNLVLMSQAWEIDRDGVRVGYVTRHRDHFGNIRVQLPSQSEIAAQPLCEVHSGFDVFSRAMRAFDTAGVFCTVVYSRELWTRVEGYNSTQLVNPDMHFIMKVLRTDPKVIYVRRPLYSYRRHAMGQAAQQARSRVIRFEVDEYSYTMQYDDSWLKGTGVSRDHIRQVFVDRDCLRRGFSSLSAGDRSYAARLLAFAMASYPAVTLRTWKSYALLAALLTGPVAVASLRVAKRRLRGELPTLGDVVPSMNRPQ